MMCMRKHIDRTDFLDGVFHAQQTQVAGLRSRIAANVNDTFRLGEENSVDHIIMPARGGSVIITSGRPCWFMKSCVRISFISPA